MKVKSESEVAQSCPTLRDPMDCSLPGSSIRGIFQATVLEWGAIAFSLGSIKDVIKQEEPRNTVNYSECPAANLTRDDGQINVNDEQGDGQNQESALNVNS